MVGRFKDKLTSFVVDLSLIQGEKEFLAVQNTSSSCATDLKPKDQEDAGFTSDGNPFFPGNKSCKLHLHDIGTVLGNIFEENSDTEKQIFTMEKVQALVEKQFQRALSGHQNNQLARSSFQSSGAPSNASNSGCRGSIICNMIRRKRKRDSLSDRNNSSSK